MKSRLIRQIPYWRENSPEEINNQDKKLLWNVIRINSRATIVQHPGRGLWPDKSHRASQLLELRPHEGPMSCFTSRLSDTSCVCSPIAWVSESHSKPCLSGGLSNALRYWEQYTSPLFIHQEVIWPASDQSPTTAQYMPVQPKQKTNTVTCYWLILSLFYWSKDNFALLFNIFSVSWWRPP